MPIQSITVASKDDSIMCCAGLQNPAEVSIGWVDPCVGLGWVDCAKVLYMCYTFLGIILKRPKISSVV